MRWKTNQWRLARADSEGTETGWGCTLRQVGTGKRLWSHHSPVVVSGHRPLTLEQWEAVGAALADGLEPPIFVDLLFDARAHLEDGDINRAAIDAAVAAETCIRDLVQTALPEQLGQQARELIDEVNIRPVVMKLLPETMQQMGLTPLDKAQVSLIHELLDARNKRMHKGVAVKFDAAKCRKFIEAIHGIVDSYS